MLSPSSTSFEAVIEQEAVLSDLHTVEESFLNQKSRIKWLNEGDKNSQYFFRAIKGKKSKMRISSIQNDDGVVLFEDTEILLSF